MRDVGTCVGVGIKNPSVGFNPIYGRSDLPILCMLWVGDPRIPSVITEGGWYRL